MTLEDAQLLMVLVHKWVLEVGNDLFFLSLNLLVKSVYPLGHATIGGLGPTSRQWGTMLDHIREVEVVLANGTITRANEDQNSDLYWVSV
jgi:hypothetical protein